MNVWLLTFFPIQYSIKWLINYFFIFFLKIQFPCPTCIICEVECVRVFIFDISCFFFKFRTFEPYIWSHILSRDHIDEYCIFGTLHCVCNNGKMCGWYGCNFQNRWKISIKGHSLCSFLLNFHRGYNIQRSISRVPQVVFLYSEI